MGGQTKQVQTIRDNTLAVLTEMPEKRDEWRKYIVEVLTEAQAANLQVETEFFTAILSLVDGRPPEISPEKPLYPVIQTLSQQLARPRQAPVMQQDSPWPSDLPADFVTWCVAGLNGSLEDKESLFEYLPDVNRKTASPEISTLIKHIQFLLFGKKPSSLTPSLPEPYAAVWQQIISRLT